MADGTTVNIEKQSSSSTGWIIAAFGVGLWLLWTGVSGLLGGINNLLQGVGAVASGVGVVLDGVGAVLTDLGDVIAAAPAAIVNLLTGSTAYYKTAATTIQDCAQQAYIALVSALAMQEEGDINYGNSPNYAAMTSALVTINQKMGWFAGNFPPDVSNGDGTVNEQATNLINNWIQDALSALASLLEVSSPRMMQGTTLTYGQFGVTVGWGSVEGAANLAAAAVDKQAGAAASQWQGKYNIPDQIPSCQAQAGYLAWIATAIGATRLMDLEIGKLSWLPLAPPLAALAYAEACAGYGVPGWWTGGNATTEELAANPFYPPMTTAVAEVVPPGGTPQQLTT